MLRRWALRGLATADMFADSPSCYKPSKPYQFTNQDEVDDFNEEVEEYKRCIMEFVEEQREEAKNHIEAADDAIEEWNRFVRLELN